MKVKYIETAGISRETILNRKKFIDAVRKFEGLRKGFKSRMRSAHRNGVRSRKRSSCKGETQKVLQNTYIWKQTPSGRTE